MTTPENVAAARAKHGAVGGQLPHNLTAERALLGVIMERNDSLYEVTGLVARSDFWEPWHGELFTLMRDLIETGRAVNPSTLMHDFAQDTDIGGVGALEYMTGLLADAPPSSTARDLAKQIHDLALKRSMVAGGERLAELARTAPASMSAFEILGKMEEFLDRQFRSLSETGVRPLAEAGDDVLRRAAEASKRDTTIGLPIGVAGVQDLIGPLMPGRLYIMAGGAGSGKSALAAQIAENVAKATDYRGARQPVLMFEMEMEDEELAERALAGAIGIKAEKIERAAVNWEELERLFAANEDLRKVPFFVDSSSAQTVAGMRSKAMRMKRLFGLALVIADHLLYFESPDRSLREFDAIRKNLQGSKKLAKDLGVPLLLLAQLKMEYSSDRNIRRPNVGDVYGGSAVEQEADVLFFVYREEVMLRRREPPKTDMAAHAEWAAKVLACETKAEIILGKRRGGKGFGIREIYFDETRVRFSDRFVAPSGPADLEGLARWNQD